MTATLLAIPNSIKQDGQIKLVGDRSSYRGGLSCGRLLRPFVILLIEVLVFFEVQVIVVIPSVASLFPPRQMISHCKLKQPAQVRSLCSQYAKSKGVHTLLRSRSLDHLNDSSLHTPVPRAVL